MDECLSGFVFIFEVEIHFEDGEYSIESEALAFGGGSGVDVVKGVLLEEAVVKEVGLECEGEVVGAGAPLRRRRSSFV